MRFKLKIKMLFVLISFLFLVNISTAQEKSTSIPEARQIKPKIFPSKKKSNSTSKKSKTFTQKSSKKALSKKRTVKKSSSAKPEKTAKKDEKKSTEATTQTDDSEETTVSKTEESFTENETAPSEKTVASEKQNPPIPLMKEGDSLPFMQKKSLETPTQETNSTSVLTKTFGALFIVLGILFFGVWGLRKAGVIKPSNKNIENSPELAILSSISPQNGQTISIVQFGKQTLLVGSTANSFTLLANAGEILTNDNERLEKMIEKTNDNFDFENKPRSVSEILAEEDESFIFKQELKKAQNRISNLRNYGGNN